MDVQATGEAFNIEREHPGLQNMKILYLIIFMWVIFVLLGPDPDPATQIYADPDADPDPQPCREAYKFKTRNTLAAYQE